MICCFLKRVLPHAFLTNGIEYFTECGAKAMQCFNINIYKFKKKYGHLKPDKQHLMRIKGMMRERNSIITQWT